MSLRVVLADDHELLREGLRALLQAQGDFDVVGEAGDGLRAIELVERLSPQVIVLDVGMPQLSGIETARIITSRSSGTRIVALSMHADSRFVAEMFRAGASGYLLKDCAFEELAVAIRAVAAGKTFMSPQLTGQAPASASSAFELLTPRQRQILQLMAEGKSTKQIALLLKVSVKTTETHRRQIMAKLDLHSVAELTRYAIREGLSPLESIRPA